MFRRSADLKCLLTREIGTQGDATPAVEKAPPAQASESQDPGRIKVVRLPPVGRGADLYTKVILVLKKQQQELLET